jgi:ribosomally synthesized peptide
VGQRSVEILIGRLVTDEDLRQRFIAEPRETIRLAQRSGLQLTAAEVDALLASSVAVWEGLAGALDPRLQKASLRRGRSLPEW